MIENDGPSTEASFRKVLKSHGYAFQYGLAAELASWFRGNAGPWRVISTEVPVVVQGHATRIDFVLENQTRPVMIVAECKRPNPALANWCFAHAPSVLGGGSSVVLGDRIRFPQFDPAQLYAWGEQLGTASESYDIAFEIRATMKGEPHTAGRGAIEDALTQVARGVNGLIELVQSNRNLILGPTTLNLVGVVFTTATLWVSDVRLERTDLKTGEPNFEGSKFAERPWIAYRYHLTPNLRHSRLPDKDAMNLQQMMERDFVRTIFIVSPKGVAQFLQWAATGLT